MSVMLDLQCNGCDAATRVGPLRRRAVSVFGGGLCVIKTDDPEDLAPEGWVMFDPWTYLVYCPTCWAVIESSDDEEEHR